MGDPGSLIAKNHIFQYFILKADNHIQIMESKYPTEF